MTEDFAAVALHRPSRPENIGGVLRAADVYGVELVVLGGGELPPEPLGHPTDTTQAWRRIPVVYADVVLDALPDPRRQRGADGVAAARSSATENDRPSVTHTGSRARSHAYTRSARNVRVLRDRAALLRASAELNNGPRHRPSEAPSDDIGETKDAVRHRARPAVAATPDLSRALQRAERETQPHADASAKCVNGRRHPENEGCSAARRASCRRCGTGSSSRPHPRAPARLNTRATGLRIETPTDNACGTKDGVTPGARPVVAVTPGRPRAHTNRAPSRRKCNAAGGAIPANLRAGSGRTLRQQR